MIEVYDVVLVLVPALLAFTFIFIYIKYIIQKKSPYIYNIQNLDWMYWAILIIIGVFFAISFKFPFIFMAKELNLPVLFFYIFLGINSCLSAFIIFELNRSPQGEEFTFYRLAYTFLISLIFLALFPSCVVVFLVIFNECFSDLFMECYQSFLKLFDKILDNIIPVAYADSDSESTSSLSSAMTTYSYSHMPWVSIILQVHRRLDQKISVIPLKISAEWITLNNRWIDFYLIFMIVYSLMIHVYWVF